MTKVVLIPVTFGVTLMQAESLPHWNGRKAAVSLTFDDGDPSHTGTAIPLLDRFGLKATFFLIGDSIARSSSTEVSLWQSAFAAGHEPGVHSRSHPHPQGLNPAQLKTETLETKRQFQKLFARPLCSYAYPFGETTPALKKLTGKHFIASRGGGHSGFYVRPDRMPDWTDIPSRTTLTRLPLSEYTNWINEAIRRESWLVFMIHGIGGTPWGWEPMPLEIFEALLDYLASKSEEVWTAPFGDVAEHLRKIKPKN